MTHGGVYRYHFGRIKIDFIPTGDDWPDYVHIWDASTPEGKTGGVKMTMPEWRIFVESARVARREARYHRRETS